MTHWDVLRVFLFTEWLDCRGDI